VPRVVLPRSLAEHTGGELDLELPGADVRALIAALDARFPGLAGAIEGRMAVAIDGEIVGDPLLESVEPGSEVHFLPRLGGG
jgi:molybdopterin converting factor small subunit